MESTIFVFAIFTTLAAAYASPVVIDPSAFIPEIELLPVSAPTKTLLSMVEVLLFETRVDRGVLVPSQPEPQNDSNVIPERAFLRSTFPVIPDRLLRSMIMPLESNTLTLATFITFDPADALPVSIIATAVLVAELDVAF